MTALATWKHRGTLAVVGNATAEATVDTTPRKIIAPTFTAETAQGLTIAPANNEIVCVTGGDYLAILSISFSGATGKTIEAALYIDAVAQYPCLSRDMSSSNFGSAGFNGLITLAAGEAVSVYQWADSATIMTVKDMQLTLVRVS